MKFNKAVWEHAREQITSQRTTFACNAVLDALYSIYLTTDSDERQYVGNDYMQHLKDVACKMHDGIPPFWNKTGNPGKVVGGVNRVEEYRNMRIAVMDKLMEESNETN